MKVGPYRESMQQYLAALERKEQRSVKAAQVEEKLVYRSYVRLGRNFIQASWDTGAQISVCTKPLAIKLGLKWTKPTETTNMVTVNGQKSPTLGIVENNLKRKGENLKLKLSTQPQATPRFNGTKRMKTSRS